MAKLHDLILDEDQPDSSYPVVTESHARELLKSLSGFYKFSQLFLCRLIV